MSKVLVTGGAGFIGSHTCLELLNAGHEVVVLDNLSNSSAESLKRVQTLTSKTLDFIEGDILDQQVLDQIFSSYNIEAVIHFAGLKAVGESQEFPLKYFENNISGSISLVKAMERAEVFNLVFSSSATVYDEANVSPLNETMPTGMPSNNYGYTKLIVEQLLEKMAVSDTRWSIALLRYFNPVGAHESAKIGELPKGIPNNLVPYVTQTAAGIRETLSVWGDDYPTRDGTAIRDYIDVNDLADAHVKAMTRLIENKNKTALEFFNLGTGTGSTVLEVVQAFENANDLKINYQIQGRREGDIVEAYANNTLAKTELGWEPKTSLEESLRNSWKWEQGLRAEVEN